jgi:hypothetical protein
VSCGELERVVSLERVAVPAHACGARLAPNAPQVALYLLLLADRYQQACPMGALWVMPDGPTMRAVTASPAELAALMQHRNRLAAALVGDVSSGRDGTETRYAIARMLLEA